MEFILKFSPLPAINGDIGWPNCMNRRKLIMARFSNRLINLDHSRLIKRIFVLGYENKQNNWCSNIEDIFDNVNLLHVFQNMSLCCITDLDSRLRIDMQNKWLIQCQNMPKLRTYIKFKHEFYTEDYVKMYLPRYERSLLARLGCGVFPLRIETGRFQNIKDPVTNKFRKMKVEERICIFCQNDAIEDELHFICICEQYSEFRDILFDSVSDKCQRFIGLHVADKMNYLINWNVNCYRNI